MGRHKKYFTDEESKEANRANARKWGQKNKEVKKAYDAEYRATLTGICVKKSSNYRKYDRERFGTDESSVTTEQMKEMIELQPHCFYCGCEDLMQLGLDRIDNNKPHTVDNCVVACWNCNNHRQKMPFENFCNKKGLTI